MITEKFSVGWNVEYFFTLKELSCLILFESKNKISVTRSDAHFFLELKEGNFNDFRKLTWNFSSSCAFHVSRGFQANDSLEWQWTNCVKADSLNITTKFVPVLTLKIYFFRKMTTWASVFLLLLIFPGFVFPFLVCFATLTHFTFISLHIFLLVNRESCQQAS